MKLRHITFAFLAGVVLWGVFDLIKYIPRDVPYECSPSERPLQGESRYREAVIQYVTAKRHWQSNQFTVCFRGELDANLSFWVVRKAKNANAQNHEDSFSVLVNPKTSKIVGTLRFQ